jgi:transmembrane sensor
MSGVNLVQSRKHAEEVENIAATWLARGEFATLSGEDQAALEDWLAQAWQHRAAYWRLKVVWDETYRFAALRRTARDEMATKPRAEIWSSVRIAALAAIAIMIAGGAAVLSFGNHREQIVSTALGGRKVIELAGGSRAELNTSTIIRIASGGRNVRLDRGEAYFQIKHDAKQPFVVAVAGYRVIDLGTKFVVLNDAGRLRVALLEGRARLEAAYGHSQATTLSPGDVAVATDGAVSVTREAPQEMAKALGWRHGVLVFEHTSLAEAMAQFNRYNAAQLVIADSGAAKLTVDGTFPVNGVNQFASAAKTIFGLHVARRGNEIVISR